MKMHWTTRSIFAAVFFASLAWAAEIPKDEMDAEGTELDIVDTDLNDDILGPEQKIISIGNVGE